MTLHLAIRQWLLVGGLNALAVMLPGPDFAIVTQNTLLGTRQHGLLTAAGIAVAIIIHVSYCCLGLAWLILHTPGVLTGIRWLGGLYLIGLGIKSLCRKIALISADNSSDHPTHLSYRQAFLSGFICNLLNPKAALFFIAIFSLVLTQPHPLWVDMGFVVAVAGTTLVWFSFLSITLTHHRVTHFIERFQPAIIKVMGGCLIIFGLVMLLFDKI